MNVLKTLAAVAVFAMAASGSAMAATCSAGAAGAILQNATGAAATCDAGLVNNDNPLPGRVNGDELFGFSDWLYAGKQNIGGVYENGTVDVSFAVDDDAFSGAWSFVSTLFQQYKNVMIVLKGGVGSNTQSNYVGYLLNSTLLPNGTFESAFFNPNNGNAKEISHISAYVREALPPPPPPPPPAPVPLPAAGLLLVAGLGGLAALRRRKTA